MEVLAVCTGVWLAVKLDPRLIKNDGEPLTFALANGVLGLRAYRQVVAWVNGERDQQAREPGVHARRSIGTTLRPFLHTFRLISEAIAPYIKETPEQAIARKADMARPLPEAAQPFDLEAARKEFEKITAPSTPAPSATHWTLPAPTPRPIYRTHNDLALIREWQRVERLRELHPDGRVPLTVAR